MRAAAGLRVESVSWKLKLAIVLGSIGALVGATLVEVLYRDGWLDAMAMLLWSSVVVGPAALWCLRHWLRHAFDVQPWRTAALVCAGLMAYVLAGTPYIFLLNALTAGERTIEFKGKVLSKREVQGKGAALVVVTSAPAGREPIQFAVRRFEFDAVRVGQDFSRCMAVGGLGMPFRWKHGESPTCSRQP